MSHKKGCIQCKFCEKVFNRYFCNFHDIKEETTIDNRCNLFASRKYKESSNEKIIPYFKTNKMTFINCTKKFIDQTIDNENRRTSCYSSNWWEEDENL